MAIKTCPVCRTRFEGRRDKVCCSERCKKRLQRAPRPDENLKQAFDEANSAIRLMAMYTDDPDHKARAINMLRSIVRSAGSELDDMYRWALASELRESVDVSKVGG